MAQAIKAGYSFEFSSNMHAYFTRGHDLKFQKSRTRLLVRKYVFTVVDAWNNLCYQAVIHGSTINKFMRFIGPLLWHRRGLTTSQRRIPVPILTAPSYTRCKGHQWDHLFSTLAEQGSVFN